MNTDDPRIVQDFCTFKATRLRDWNLIPETDWGKKHAGFVETLKFRAGAPFRPEVIYFTKNLKITAMFIGPRIIFLPPNFPIPEPRSLEPPTILIDQNVENIPVCMSGQEITITVEHLDEHSWDLQLFGTLAT